MLWQSVWLQIVLLSIMKIVVGIFGNSNVLIVDRNYFFSDLSIDIVTIIGKKTADEKHP